MRLIEHKTVVILGAGLTGLSMLRFCLESHASVTVMDSRQAPPLLKEFEAYQHDVELIFGAFNKSLLTDADYILVSPGVDLNNVPMARDELEAKMLSDIELFVFEATAPVVAVTGSNGKSTVCDALGFVLNTINRKTVVAGNIGVPVLDLLGKDIPEFYVLELSSFQLDLVKSLKAKVACILNVTEDHLDRHGSMAAYVNAKQKIYQGSELCVYNFNDPLTKPRLESHSSRKYSELTFGFDQNADIRVVLSEQGFSVNSESRMYLSEAETKLKGAHNGLNIAAILAILSALELPVDQDAISAIKNYSGLAHRCQEVETNDGVLWVNDSKATNVGSAISAIQSYRPKGKTLFLIAGGDLKGADCFDFSIVVNENVDQIWAFGKDAEILTAAIDKNKVHRVSLLSEAVSGIKQSAKPGDCVLLSPACASTDMYRNYEERGSHFVQLLKEAS
ncbi:MAG: UDP-N-acetylmuramoyl-L-alanine--D-glutamate ligase [Gammaproteobacteria bacterium]|nr:UDP-N-acetylmuramoyl-L-alanine--D-glutamate ligase [Gammaproteobacteria bacterium]